MSARHLVAILGCMFLALPLRALEVPLADLKLASPYAEPRLQAALDHLQQRLKELGVAPLPAGDSAATPQLRLMLLDHPDAPRELRQQWAALKDWQQQEAFALISSGNGITLLGGGFMGLVYGLSEMQVRLRLSEEGGHFSFTDQEAAAPQLQAPAIQGRGEYLNIGYIIPGITPHDWDEARWREYVDRLLLAKLNRFYFYLWINSYTAFPESELAEKPLNQKLHRNLRFAIDYAQRRGLHVTVMISPTFMPKDLWDARPEMHAQISYVDHGFPVGCPRAPGAMDLMKRVWQSELEWFRAADAVQIWFYDPGGCWCERYGCKEHQAESLAAQFGEFAGLFRQINPKGEVEYNYWPAWLWEDLQKTKYRDETARLIAAQGPPETIAAVGASDNDITLPLMEVKHGFRGDAFIFATNPESGYAFVIPHLQFSRENIQRSRQHGIRAVFGHRLEAWTRFPETFVLGDWLWNPDLPEEDALQRFGAWLAADDPAGQLVARSYKHLDTLIHEAAHPEAQPALTAAQEAFTQTPPAAKPQVGQWLEMIELTHLLAQSVGEEDEAKLETQRNSFLERAAKSTDYQMMADPNANWFQNYRKHLSKPWKDGVY